MSREKITKGWWVEAVLDDDKPDPFTNTYLPKRISRVYHVYQAAADYAAFLRAHLKVHPESVNIRTKSGYDDIEIRGRDVNA
jgi:hypothetical protein